MKLMKLGFAQSSPYGNSPHKYLEQYKAAQKEAQDKELGLWNPSACKARDRDSDGIACDAQCQ